MTDETLPLRRSIPKPRSYRVASQDGLGSSVVPVRLAKGLELQLDRLLASEGSPWDGRSDLIRWLIVEGLRSERLKGLDADIEPLIAASKEVDAYLFYHERILQYLELEALTRLKTVVRKLRPLPNGEILCRRLTERIRKTLVKLPWVWQEPLATLTKQAVERWMVEFAASPEEDMVSKGGDNGPQDQELSEDVPATLA